MKAAVKITDTLPAGADEKKLAGSRPRRRLTNAQIREHIAKKMRELELLQAAITISERAIDCFHNEYEKMQEYFLSTADRRFFAILAEYGANFPRLEELREHAQAIARQYLPYGLTWDWKWYLREMVKESALPPCVAMMYRLEEKELLGREGTM